MSKSKMKLRTTPNFNGVGVSWYGHAPRKNYQKISSEKNLIQNIKIYFLQRTMSHEQRQGQTTTNCAISCVGIRLFFQILYIVIYI